MGRELDAQVAEKVMGFKWMRNTTGRSDFPKYDKFPIGCKCLVPVDHQKRMGWTALLGGETKTDAWDYYLPHYSTRIEDAWKVVERVASLRSGGSVSIIRRADGVFRVEIGDGAEEFIARSKAAPEAICLAALKALATPPSKEAPR